MVAAFFPEGPPKMMRPRFPTPPHPPPGAFRLRRRVEWRDVDGAQHVNNAIYLAYFKDCAMRAAAVHDWPLTRMRMEGLVILARRHHIEYRQPALLGEELELVTWVSDVEQTRAVRHFAVSRVSDGAVLARARSFVEWVDEETEQPVPIPSAFLEDLAPNIADARPREA
jgi:YbgC/YbaW family acyl-CoA thioester hydrolase